MNNWGVPHLCHSKFATSLMLYYQTK
jgi:hypothetical protein